MIKGCLLETLECRVDLSEAQTVTTPIGVMFHRQAPILLAYFTCRYRWFQFQRNQIVILLAAVIRSRHRRALNTI